MVGSGVGPWWPLRLKSHNQQLELRLKIGLLEKTPGAVGLGTGGFGLGQIPGGAFGLEKGAAGQNFGEIEPGGLHGRALGLETRAGGLNFEEFGLGGLHGRALELETGAAGLARGGHECGGGGGMGF